MTGQKLGAIVFFAVIGMVSRLNGATITIPDDAATINEAMGLARSAGDEIGMNVGLKYRTDPPAAGCGCF